MSRDHLVPRILASRFQQPNNRVTPGVGAPLNCEPCESCKSLGADGDRTLAAVAAQGDGAIGVLARITNHTEGLATPAVDGITVDTVTGFTIGEAATFARRITQRRSYLGAYPGVFREGDVFYSPVPGVPAGHRRPAPRGEDRRGLRRRPAAEMLDQGRRLATEHGVRNIRRLQGDSTAPRRLGLPPLDLVAVAAMPPPGQRCPRGAGGLVPGREEWSSSSSSPWASQRASEVPCWWRFWTRRPRSPGVLRPQGSR